MPVLPKLKKFLQLEAAGGIFLFFAMILAMFWANSTWSHHYFEFVQYPIGVFQIQETLQFWVNDALMTLFFFNVTLEIKREMTVGELSTKKKAVLPLIAAGGGMVVPAVIYLFFNPTGVAANGWGIPMATDIAFSIGVLTLLGKRVPLAAKVFLLTLAVADDLGGIIVIAIFYAQKLVWSAIFSALLFFVFIIMLREMKVKNIFAYIFLSIAAWYCVHATGIHATMTGVVLAMILPTLEASRQNNLHVITNFFILPLFALVNTGIVISNISFNELFANPIFLGIGLGLLVGKPIGIFASTYIAVKLKAGDLPNDVKLKHVFGIGIIAGIGLTVATFMSHLALSQSPHLEVYAKMGILIASALAAILGIIAASFW